VASKASCTDNNGTDWSIYLVDPTNRKLPLAGGNLNALVGCSVYDGASANIGRAILKYLPRPNLCKAAEAFTIPFPCGQAPAADPH
jgi:hypothetical protein